MRNAQICWYHDPTVDKLVHREPFQFLLENLSAHMKSNSLPCSLVLAVDGMKSDPASQRLILKRVKEIESSGIFSAVLPFFVNNETDASEVLTQVASGDVVIVALTSDELYPNQLFPRGKMAGLNAFRIFFTSPLSRHPEIPSLVADRIETLMDMLGMNASETTVVVVNNDTGCSTDGETSAALLTQRMCELLPEYEIRVAHLATEPSIPSVIAETHRPHLMIVPFSFHCERAAMSEMLESFGLSAEYEVDFPLVDLIGSRLIVCDLPVGLYPEIAELCLELASDQLLTGKPFSWA